MEKVIAYAKLPLKLDILRAQTEVVSIMNNEKRHFNTADYTGEWTVISLRSSNGEVATIMPNAREGETFKDTVLMEQCLSIKELIQSFECPVMAVRLLNLKKGAVIKEHRDVELSFEKGEARLHFPIFTNPQVEFYVAGERVDMQEGECWYINANLPHRVSNLGVSDRLHLVVDCEVDDWLRSIFDTAEILNIVIPEIKPSAASVIDKKEESKMVIKELRKQNTETTNRMADELEAELFF